MINKVSFGASVQEVTSALPKAKICPGKKMFVASVTNYFQEIEKQMKNTDDAPDTFEYRLDGENEIPESLKNLSVEGTTLEEFDKTLSEDTFCCHGKSCGGGINRKTLMNKILTAIGVEKPDTIDLKK